MKKREKEKLNPFDEQAKAMDEVDKRKEIMQDEKELNPDTFTKEVSADNQALLDAAKHCSERTRFHWPNQVQPAYDAFIAGAQWQKEQDQQTIELAEEHALLAGIMQERERMMKDAIDATVTGVREYREENEVDFTIMLDKGIVPYVSEEDVKLIIIKE